MKYIDRDISWLAFNARVLQEVENPCLPLMERLKFAAIYSSNLEEFYRVRVAGHRFAQRYRGDQKNRYGYRPSFILQEINAIVGDQQEKLGRLFFEVLVPEMADEGIYFLHDELELRDQTLVSNYYESHLKEQFSLVDITDLSTIDLKNQAIYLYILSENRKYLLEMDYEKWGRFITIYQDEQETRIIQLDDIFRYNAAKFLNASAEVFAVKISRDAELYIEEEQDIDIVRKIKKSLKKRETGLPSRLLFNENIPFKHINALRKKMKLDMTSLIPGGQYHSFYDFFKFPFFEDKSHLYHPEFQTIPCKRLDASVDWFAEVKKSDLFLSFPYQDFRYVTRFLRLAAEDPEVLEINITLYRVNDSSEICQALELAAQKGKKVFVLAEVLARFDEISNIYWGERLEKAGAKVKYGIKKLKVHAKTFAIHRRENNQEVTYAYLGTGNLNEKTAGLYADHGILTADERYTNDLCEVFSFMKKATDKPVLNHLLVAPFVLRDSINRLLDNEIEIAKSGDKAEAFIKINSLEDLQMIDKIREAADAGVKVSMVVRGICCYYPQTPEQGRNIKIVSVVDRFLEHTRIYYFTNGGNPVTYQASADLMTRNLSSRIEVGFPVWDIGAQQLLLDQINYQLTDGIKGRINDNVNNNDYVTGANDKTSQELMFDLVNKLNEQSSYPNQKL